MEASRIQHGMSAKSKALVQRARRLNGWLRWGPKSLLRRSIHRTIMFITLGAHYFRLRKMIGRLKRENPARRIVAIDLTEHLGDIIACEPVASYVQQCYPHAHVIWFVRRLYKDLIAYNPNIDTAFPIYCISEWIYLSRTTLFDEIVDLHFEGRILSPMSGAVAQTSWQYGDHRRKLLQLRKLAVRVLSKRWSSGPR